MHVDACRRLGQRGADGRNTRGQTAVSGKKGRSAAGDDGRESAMHLPLRVRMRVGGVRWAYLRSGRKHGAKRERGGESLHHRRPGRRGVRPDRGREKQLPGPPDTAFFFDLGGQSCAQDFCVLTKSAKHSGQCSRSRSITGSSDSAPVGVPRSSIVSIGEKPRLVKCPGSPPP